MREAWQLPPPQQGGPEGLGALFSQTWLGTAAGSDIFPGRGSWQGEFGLSESQIPRGELCPDVLLVLPPISRLCCRLRNPKPIYSLKTPWQRTLSGRQQQPAAIPSKPSSSPLPRYGTEKPKFSAPAVSAVALLLAARPHELPRTSSAPPGPPFPTGGMSRSPACPWGRHPGA